MLPEGDGVPYACVAVGHARRRRHALRGVARTGACALRADGRVLAGVCSLTMQRDPTVELTAEAIDGGSLLPGDILDGRYRIDAVIGRGGMSTVYRATHLRLEQPVALKVLSTSALAVPEYVARLEHEARSLSRLRSKHVVRVYDAGDHRGVPYLAMECLSGRDLAALLRRGPLPVDLAIDCIMQACDALAEAHARGIVHRDLKPANLFLADDPAGGMTLKILDFGIARSKEDPVRSRLTDPGSVLGTPNYMAPEQMEASDRIDDRTDIWALGAILYELLVGRPPYRGQSLPQIYMKIMRSPPRPVSTVRADVPEALDVTLCKCLAFEPYDRHRSVVDLARDLSSVRADLRVARGPRRRRPDGSRRATTKHVATASVAGFAVAAAVLLGMLSLGEAAPSSESDFLDEPDAGDIDTLANSI